MNFLCLGMYIFFLFQFDLHSFNLLHKWCSPHYVWIMWKELIERISGLQKEVCIILFNVLYIYIYRYNFDFFTKMYFDHLLKFCVSYCYYIAQAIHDSNPFIPLQTCFKLHGYSSFKKKKKPKYLKCRYLANYFKKMKQNILKLIR